MPTKLTANEKLKQNQNKLVDELIELMRKGRNPWQRPWNPTNSTHQNLDTGNAYHGQNVPLLDIYMAARGYSMPLWIGANQARKYKLHPAKGSKGCYIKRPFLRAYEKETKENEEKVLISYMDYKLVPVFNVQDLTGDEKNKEELISRFVLPTDKPPLEKIQACEDVIRTYHKTQGIETRWGGDRCYYSPSEDYIGMAKKEQFKTKEGYYAVHLHELGHSTGHHKRLNRSMKGSKGSATYAREELIAELTSTMCCRRLGISSNLENHASYLQSWISVLSDDPEILFKSLTKASKAVELILGKDKEVETS